MDAGREEQRLRQQQQEQQQAAPAAAAAAGRAAAVTQAQQLPLSLLPLSCWPSVIAVLSARDLLALRLASRSTKQLLDETPGLWSQACSSCLGWPAAAAAGPPAAAAAAAPDAEDDDDRLARRILAAMTAVAHLASSAVRPQLKPSSYSLPVWLAAQPGKARGFSMVRDAQPPLALTEAQVHWLSLGCLAGHASGVFVSSCTSSPRTCRPCGAVAAVVVDKALVAELYLPATARPPPRWAGLLSPPPPPTDAAPAAPAPVELWVSSSVSFDSTAAAEESAGRGASRRRAGAGHGGGGGGGGGGGSCTWREVHRLVMSCVEGNAARARAVRGTCIVAPGTPAVGPMEAALAELVECGAPVLDLRRLSCTAPPAGHAGVAPAGAALPPSQQQQQQQQQQQGAAASGSSQPRCSRPSSRRRGRAAAQASAAAQPTSQQRLSLRAARQQWAGVSGAVQAALWAAVAGKPAPGGADGAAAPDGATPDDDAVAEALASVVEQLPGLAPQLQLLVLPVILPGGRIGHRLPGGRSGSRLSAPRLLSLNVPFLVPARSAWDRLPLRAMVLAAGAPLLLPLPAAAVAARASPEAPAPARTPPAGDEAGDDGPADARRRPRPGGSGGGGGVTMHGVFSQQQLELQWQQQMHLQAPARGAPAAVACERLPAHALDAVVGMASSCMDRLAPHDAAAALGRGGRGGYI